MKHLLLSLLLVGAAGYSAAEFDQEGANQLKSRAGQLALNTMMGAKNVIVEKDKSFVNDKKSEWNKLIEELKTFITKNSPKNLSSQNKKLFDKTTKKAEKIISDLYENIDRLRSQIGTKADKPAPTSMELKATKATVETFNKMRKDININEFNPFWNDYTDTKSLKRVLQSIMKTLKIMVDRASSDATNIFDIYQKALTIKEEPQKKV